MVKNTRVSQIIIMNYVGDTNLVWTEMVMKILKALQKMVLNYQMEF